MPSPSYARFDLSPLANAHLTLPRMTYPSVSSSRSLVGSIDSRFSPSSSRSFLVFSMYSSLAFHTQLVLPRSLSSSIYSDCLSIPAEEVFPEAQGKSCQRTGRFGFSASPKFSSASALAFASSASRSNTSSFLSFTCIFSALKALTAVSPLSLTVKEARISAD